MHQQHSLAVSQLKHHCGQTAHVVCTNTCIERSDSLAKVQHMSVASLPSECYPYNLRQ